MATTRLSPLDASFLAVESPTAHMHVGWAATFRPPEGRPRPSFDDLFDHIESRLSRGRRFRQRLARVPLGLNAPDTSGPASGRADAAASSRVSVKFVASVVPPTSDMTTNFCPPGPTSRMSTSSGSVCEKPLSVSVILQTVP